MLFNQYLLLLCCILAPIALGAVTEQSVVESIAELNPHNLTTNLDEWESDLAIMFYAPWCKYCKQLLPSWGTIAALTESNPNLVVGRFNCESSEKSGDLCKELLVDRYPSVYFLGYGNFNQAVGGGILGRNKNPRIVRYVADLYPEAIYDWVTMLTFLSTVHRRWEDFIGFFTGKSRMKAQIDRLKERVGKEERRSYLFGKELERYKANELFDKLEDQGDPFPVLHNLPPDQNNLPLRVCVAEMASEYCQYYKDDKYCQILPQCSSRNLEPEVCRPKACPFEDHRGCVVVSTCMKPDIIQQYKTALSSYSDSTGTAAGTSADSRSSEGAANVVISSK